MKPVVALAAMQEHLLAPYESIQCTPTATYGLDKQVFKNWDPYVNQPMTLRRRSRSRATRTSTTSATASTAAATRAATRLQQWARRFGFGAPTGLDLGGEADGPRPDAGLAQEDVQERLGPGLEPRRLDPARDRPEGRHRDAAPDGALLRDARERRQARDAVRRLGGRAARQRAAQAPVVVRRFTPDPPRVASASTPPRSQVVRDGLYAATHSTHGTSSGVFGALPGPDRGEDGDGREGRAAPRATRPAISRISRGGAAGGRRRRGARIVVCALIENGGHGSTAAAPAALQVFEQWFGVQGEPRRTLVETD